MFVMSSSIISFIGILAISVNIVIIHIGVITNISVTDITIMIHDIYIEREREMLGALGKCRFAFPSC